MSTRILTATNALSALELERLRLVVPSRRVKIEHMQGVSIDDYIQIGAFTDTSLVTDVLDNHLTNFYADEDSGTLFIEYHFRNLDSVISTVNRYNKADRITGVSNGLVESDTTNLTIIAAYPLEEKDMLTKLHTEIYLEALKAAFYQ